MPTYEYRCEYCHEHVEAFQRMSDQPLTTCPHCGKEGLKRLVSGGAGVIYKGEGWYVTDYSKKSSGGKDLPSSSSSGASSSGSKPESPGGNASSTDSSSGNSSGSTAKTGS